jgi:hypothetical protein
MIVQVILTSLLGGLLLYAAKERRQSPAVAAIAAIAAAAGLYVVWVPSYATALAQWAGVGRGVDLFLYVWAVISFVVLLNLHLKLRSQMELITRLARRVALMTSAERGYVGDDAPRIGASAAKTTSNQAVYGVDGL